MKAVGLPIIPAELILHRVEKQIGVGQRIAVDPLEGCDAKYGEEFRYRIEVFHRVVVDKEECEEGDVDRDEELPEEIDLGRARP